MTSIWTDELNWIQLLLLLEGRALPEELHRCIYTIRIWSATYNGQQPIWVVSTLLSRPSPRCSCPSLPFSVGTGYFEGAALRLGASFVLQSSPPLARCCSPPCLRKASPRLSLTANLCCARGSTGPALQLSNARYLPGSRSSQMYTVVHGLSCEHRQAKHACQGKLTYLSMVCAIIQMQNNSKFMHVIHIVAQKCTT